MAIVDVVALRHIHQCARQCPQPERRDARRDGCGGGDIPAEHEGHAPDRGDQQNEHGCSTRGAAQLHPTDNGGEERRKNSGGQQPGNNPELHSSGTVQRDGHEPGRESQRKGGQHGERIRRIVPRATHRPHDSRHQGSQTEHDAAEHDAAGEALLHRCGASLGECESHRDHRDHAEHPPQSAALLARYLRLGQVGGCRAAQLQVDDRVQGTIRQFSADTREFGFAAAAFQHGIPASFRWEAQPLQHLTKSVVVGHCKVDAPIAGDDGDAAALRRGC